MKKIITFIAVILFSQLFHFKGFAQTPNAIPYQGVARNASGAILGSQPISLRFSLHDVTAVGTVVYQETHSATTTTLGLFTLNIGLGTSSIGTMASVDWANGAKFLQVEMDATGGTAYVDMGTTQMLSVPFALYAKIAGSTPGSLLYKGTWNASTNTPNLSSGVGTAGEYYTVTGISSSIAGTLTLSVTLDGAGNWDNGDWAIYNGTIWQKVDNSEAPNIQQHISDVTTNPHNVTKAQVGLGNADNTSDVNKPVSNAQAAADAAVLSSANSYCAASVVGLLNDRGNYDASSNVFPSSGGGGSGGAIKKGDLWTVSVAGTLGGQAVAAGTEIRALQDAPGQATSNWYRTITQNNIGYVPENNANRVTAVSSSSTNAEYPSAKLVYDQLALKEPNIVATGSTSDFWSGAKTFRNLAADVRAVPLTGLDISTNQTVSATDNPVQAVGYLQKQINDNLASSNSKLNLSGGTMTGDLILNSPPSTALGAVTKQYVDDTNSIKLNLSGGTMTGNLVLNAPPTLALGAATKQYVDDSSIPVQAQFASLIDSYIHKTEDGVSIYLEPGTTDKRFGIGITTPAAPLGIRAEGSNQKALVVKPNVLSTGSPYTFSLSASGNPGLNIESDASTGSVSRFFIQDVDGKVGIGTISPEQKLHVQGSADGGSVGVMIQNSATTKNRAWLESHFETGDIPTQDGRFAISELPIGTSGSLSPVERLTILSGGNVGINELIPDTKLHVSRPLSDPASDISLLPGTGIVTIGPMENNIVADYRGIQARHGEFIAPGSSLQVAGLNLQRLGGDVLIHGDASLASTQKAIITTDAKLGLGTISPTEKIDIDGAIKIGTTTTNNEGTIRYTGTDFEGRKAGAWVSLTGGSIWGKVDNSDSIYYTSSSQPKVGIGIATPTSSLHIFNNENVLSSSNTVFIDTQSSTSSTSSSLTRVGLEIKNSLTWSSSSDAKNIGLYVSNVSGQSSQESNIAAVLNGNVVVGDINSSQVVGTGGTNVLAIQNGAVPQTTPSSATDIGIQMYSANLPSSPGVAPVSALHIMNGNGDIMKLYKQDALTPTDTATPNSGDAATDALINNLRLRLNELETRLQNLGLLSN